MDNLIETTRLVKVIKTATEGLIKIEGKTVNLIRELDRQITEINLSLGKELEIKWLGKFKVGLITKDLEKEGQDYIL